MYEGMTIFLNTPPELEDKGSIINHISTHFENFTQNSLYYEQLKTKISYFLSTNDYFSFTCFYLEYFVHNSFTMKELLNMSFRCHRRLVFKIP